MTGTGKLAAAAVTPVLFVAILLAAVLGQVGPTLPAPGAGPNTAALADIPPAYLVLYQQAAATDCPGLDWSVLAAVGKVETDHGRSSLPGVTTGENSAGAAGPMQFLESSFAATVARHPPPPGGATPPSRYNTHDAVHAAASYLCDHGAPTDLRAAIFAYNRSTAYVDQVLATADTYRTTDQAPDRPDNAIGPGGSVAARVALDYARTQIGLPYLWGGDGPAAGEAGFDCSGLTTAAYRAAGITLPRTAQTQYLAGPLLPAGAPLAPGDLLFFGTPARVHHVGIATGNGTLMINAPRRNTLVRIQDATGFPDYLAASRPAR